MSPLVPTRPSGDDDLEGLRARVTELEALLGERAAEIARIESELAAFRIDYHQRVGRLHDELDELDRAIAEAELGELSKRVGSDTYRFDTLPANPAPEPLPRYTSDAVRRLFRDVAKAIHPDLAADEITRHRRHMLMIEANRAYALGDEERLRSILRSWETSPDTVQGNGPEATRMRLMRRITQIEEQIAGLGSALEVLKDSPAWQLKAMVDDAAGRGKDLVREMVGRLKTDIMIARNRLAAMQWSS